MLFRVQSTWKHSKALTLAAGIWQATDVQTVRQVAALEDDILSAPPTQCSNTYNMSQRNNKQ